MYSENEYKQAALATFLQKEVYGLDPNPLLNRSNQPVFGNDADLSKRRSYTEIEVTCEEESLFTNPDTGALYRVLEEPEVHDALYKTIVDSIGFFKADFIADHCAPEITADVIRYIQTSGIEEGGLHSAIRTLVLTGNGVSTFVLNAEEIDGRGHFLSPYGGAEFIVQIPGVYPIRNYHIYRIA